jgi:radical SAM-linked protein
LRVELRFSVSGRARFLSHLECVDVLLAALRRAGYAVALSEGMRPKPVISLALARGVGVEAADEIATVKLTEAADLAELQSRLNDALPQGIRIATALPSAGTPRITHAVYRVSTGLPLAQMADAVAAFAGPAPIERRSPKGTKTVDVAAFVTDLAPFDGGFTCELALTDAGSARPNEVAAALSRCAGLQLPVLNIMRVRLAAALETTA